MITSIIISTVSFLGILYNFQQFSIGNIQHTLYTVHKNKEHRFHRTSQQTSKQLRTKMWKENTTKLTRYISTTLAPQQHQQQQHTFTQHLHIHDFLKQSTHIQTTILSLILIACLFGNLLVITAISRTKKLRIPSYILIVNLSVCDMLVAVSAIPFRYLLLQLHLHGKTVGC